MCTLNSPLPCKEIHSRFLGIRTEDISEDRGLFCTLLTKGIIVANIFHVCLFVFICAAPVTTNGLFPTSNSLSLIVLHLVYLEKDF